MRSYVDQRTLLEQICISPSPMLFGGRWATTPGLLSTRSLLPEDLVASIALYSASSRLLYPNNHGAVCTGAQLELVMAL